MVCIQCSVTEVIPHKVLIGQRIIWLDWHLWVASVWFVCLFLHVCELVGCCCCCCCCIDEYCFSILGIPDTLSPESQTIRQFVI